MIWYGNPSSEAIRDAIAAGLLGCITTPDQGNLTFPDEWEVIADNGCYVSPEAYAAGKRWDEARWRRWVLGLSRQVRFAVAPDVFDPTGAPCHEATLERWATFGPMLERHGFAPAFVCQVGSTYETVPADAPVLFLGGTDEWKEGDEARRITQLAKADGRWVHMGRVNTIRRMTMALDFGCHSADGTSLGKWPSNLPVILRYLETARRRAGHEQLELFD